MNTKSDAPDLDNPPAATAADGDATAKAPRRRRAPKAAAAEPVPNEASDSGDAAAVEVAPEAAAEAMPAKKPRRRTTPKPRASDEGGDAAATSVQDAGVAQSSLFSEAPAQDDDVRTSAARQDVAEAGHVGEADDRARATGAFGEGGSDSPSVSAEGEREGEEGRGRRNRRDRRRGRRDGVDGEGGGQPDARGEGAADDSTADNAGAEPLPVAVLPKDAGEIFAQVLSGSYDAEEPVAEPAADVASQPAKRVLQPDVDAPKLQKVLAQSGIGSRRDIESLIVDGKITVNGEPAHIGQRIAHGDRIQVNGRPVKFRIAPPARGCWPTTSLPARSSRTTIRSSAPRCSASCRA